MRANQKKVVFVPQGGKKGLRMVYFQTFLKLLNSISFFVEILAMNSISLLSVDLSASP
jgi:hypothetical protein